MPASTKPVIFVIFGITGDLAQRKLLPALYHLLKDEALHPGTRIVGLSRRDVTADELLAKVELCVLETDKVCDPEVLKKFRTILEMVRFNPAELAEYKELQQRLNTIEDHNGHCMDRLFYLSIPPNVYGAVVTNLGESGIAESCPHDNGVAALLVEKPFGYDLTSAEELIADTAKHFDESQIYRIDHYLAKETAQNILTFRHENPLFQELWDSRSITHIEVMALEKIGVEGRTAFYDDVGALRDSVQSHLMQLLALVTMELPTDMNEQAVHLAKQNLLQAIEPVPVSMVHSRVLRGQYEGYPEEIQNLHSKTETYASVDLQIRNDRWQDTLVTLTNGKALAAKQTLIRLTFGDNEANYNQLTFRLQPDEGIAVTLRVKEPGLEDKTEPDVMNFDYHVAGHPDAYERVLIDAMRGDHMLFASSEEVLASWRVLQPVLDVWEQGADDLVLYKPGAEAVERP